MYFTTRHGHKAGMSGFRRETLIKASWKPLLQLCTDVMTSIYAPKKTLILWAICHLLAPRLRFAINKSLLALKPSGDGDG